jgi:hypothetical protein
MALRQGGLRGNDKLYGAMYTRLIHHYRKESERPSWQVRTAILVAGEQHSKNSFHLKLLPEVFPDGLHPPKSPVCTKFHYFRRSELCTDTMSQSYIKYQRTNSPVAERTILLQEPALLSRMASYGQSSIAKYRMIPVPVLMQPCYIAVEEYTSASG